MNAAAFLLVAAVSVVISDPCSPPTTCPHNQVLQFDANTNTFKCYGLPGSYCDSSNGCECVANANDPGSSICECDYSYYPDVNTGRCVLHYGDSCSCDGQCESGMACVSGHCSCPLGSNYAGNHPNPICALVLGSFCNPALPPQNQFPCDLGTTCSPTTHLCI